MADLEPPSEADATSQPLRRVTAAAHLFKTMVGAGIFFIPTATKASGWLGAIALGGLVTAIVADATRMLIRCRATGHAREAEGPQGPAGASEGGGQRSAYCDITTAVLGREWARVLRTALVLVQLCWCLVYLQLAAGMAAEIVGAAPSSPTYVALCFVAAAVVFPATLLTRNLELLGLATYGAVLSFVIVFAFIVADVGQRLADAGASPTAVPLVTNPIRAFAFAPVMLSALAGLPSTLPIHDAMHPQHKGRYFCAIFTGVIAFVGALYVGFGIFGYAAFGTALRTSLVSLERGTGVRTALAASVLFTLPIQLVPAIEIIDAAVDRYRRQRWALEAPSPADPPASPITDPAPVPVWRDPIAVANRTALMVQLSVVAALVGADTVGVVVGFIGATFCNATQLLFPLVIFLVCAAQPRESSAAASDTADPASGKQLDDDAATDATFALVLPRGFVPGPSLALPWVAWRRAAEGTAAPLRWDVQGRAWLYLALACCMLVHGTATSVVDAIDVWSSR